MVDPKQERLVKSKTTYKLGTLFSTGKFTVEPASGNSLQEHVAWELEKRVTDHGLKKSDDFTDFLCSMSKLVVEIVEKEYFASNGRVELAYINVGAMLHRIRSAKSQSNRNRILRQDRRQVLCVFERRFANSQQQ